MYAIVLIFPSAWSPLKQCLSASILSHSGEAIGAPFRLHLAKPVLTLPSAPPSSASTLVCTLSYFRSLLKCHFFRRPSLTVSFKFKILPSFSPCTPSSPFCFISLPSTCAGCSPLTLGIPLPLLPPFSVPQEAVLHGLYRLGSFAPWLSAELGHRRNSRGLEGERSEKPGCLFPQ